MMEEWQLKINEAARRDEPSVRLSAREYCEMQVFEHGKVKIQPETEFVTVELI